MDVSESCNRSCLSIALCWATSVSIKLCVYIMSCRYMYIQRSGWAAILRYLLMVFLVIPPLYHVMGDFRAC